MEACNQMTRHKETLYNSESVTRCWVVSGELASASRQSHRVGGQYCINMVIHADSFSMPAFPPGLIDWLQPGAIGAGFAIVWGEIRGLHRRFDDLNRRFDEQSKRIDELREDNRELGRKVDRLIESMLPAKQT